MLPQAFARLLAEQSKGGEFVDGSVHRHGKEATISFKRLEKGDYRGLVLFNRERWAGAEAELKGHSTRLAAIPRLFFCFASDYAPRGDLLPILIAYTDCRFYLRL